jgi:hypothetical protein
LLSCSLSLFFLFFFISFSIPFIDRLVSEPRKNASIYFRPSPPGWRCTRGVGVWVWMGRRSVVRTTPVRPSVRARARQGRPGGHASYRVSMVGPSRGMVR